MKVIVIGGGAAGMLAANYAAINGDSVTVIEKNEKLGKKLYITGKGRCNVTNDCDEQEFLSNVNRNSKFLMSSIYSYSSKDLMGFLESNGLPLKVERGNRVFPLSDKSSDVISCFEKALKRNKVDVKLNEEVVDVLESDGRISAVVTNICTYEADKVIICTGGISYRATGSTGDGFTFAKKFGHSVTPLYPSLTGLNIKGEDYKPLQGLTLKNVNLTLNLGGKAVYSELGEMLFTHFGISGPLVLTASSYISGNNVDNYKISIDLKPALSNKQLSDRIIRDFEKYKNKQLKNSLDDLLPKALIPLIIKRSGISENKRNNEITVEERERLIKVLKNLDFIPYSLRDFNEAIITRGGINVKEINPKTMESKLVKGLYFAGEVIDVDAFTGGFNLQIAFSTAHTAATSKGE